MTQQEALTQRTVFLEKLGTAELMQEMDRANDAIRVAEEKARDVRIALQAARDSLAGKDTELYISAVVEGKNPEERQALWGKKKAEDKVRQLHFNQARRCEGELMTAEIALAWEKRRWSGMVAKLNLRAAQVYFLAGGQPFPGEREPTVANLDVGQKRGGHEHDNAAA